MSDIELKPCPKCGSTAVRYFYYDDEVSVCCRHCQFEIAPSRLEKFAASDWNAIPRCALQWTTETPTEPGWYWHRRAKEDTPLPVRVENVGDCRPGYQWAGPIPEPQEQP